jgi:hypothetical protein
MGVLIDSATFTYGATPTSFYQSNSGDLVTATLRIRSQIRLSSINNTLQLDPTNNTITSPSVSWLEEGFRVNDWVLFYVRNSGGSVVSGPYWTQVQSVTDFVCDVTSMPVWYDFAASEYIEFYVVDASGSYQQVERNEVDVLVNHSLNSLQGNPNSLIDGEVTRVRFSNVNLASTPSTITGVILGNQSGQFLIVGNLNKIVSTDPSFFMYDLELTFVNSGLYDTTDENWFFTSECLKAFISTQWARVASEPYARLVSNYDLAGDTGFYDEPFNTGVSDSTLIQGTSNVDYGATSTHTIIVDGPLTNIMIGAAYKPTDNTYYKNQIYSQTELTMIIPSTPVALGTYSSYVNPNGAGYDIDITDISSVGSQTTIKFSFIPNPAFLTFMDSRDAEDRLFYIWVKCGNINHLVYNDILEYTPPPLGPLSMVKSVPYLDHSLNVDTYPTSYEDRSVNTEDDIAYYGEFLLDKGTEYVSFNVYVEAANSVSGDTFSLRAIQFNFDGVLVSGDGRYLLNQTLPINPQLPATSLKKDAALKLVSTLDTPTQYGVSIYAPYLMDWRYWIPYPTASSDFWPNQNKNWQQYEAGDWDVVLRLELVVQEGSYIHTESLEILDYDSEPLITQSIELYEDSTNTNVSIILEGQLHRVVATHTLGGSFIWNQTEIWGMITVEPQQNQPRWICSTAINWDNNTNNPIYPLSNALIMNITYPSLNIARMECYFNPDLINLQNGVKFTTKIKGCLSEAEVNKTTTPDNVQKTTTDNINKTTA